jgi:uncharacterized protein YjiS (DUF1127 family)
MTTTEFSTGHSHSILSLIGAGARRVASAWVAFRNRRAAAQLLGWDDRMLRDIGLTTHDVRSAFAGRLNEDPTQRLGALSNERRAARRATAAEQRHGHTIWTHFE